ncbi:MAG TPA: fatty acid desaturase [Phnomibacter sp.]|nr:fatty acid desaturase [Phnomibacter sp.]
MLFLKAAAKIAGFDHSAGIGDAATAQMDYFHCNMQAPTHANTATETTLVQELEAVKKMLKASAGVEDIRHLRKVEWLGRLSGLLGLATAWIFPNPISAWLISQYRFTCWTMLAHHILHRGYNAVPGIAGRHTSRGFAKGLRRWLDWPDWIWPPAWELEHNVLHHYHLGEHTDPDQVELNLQWLRQKNWPQPLKVAFVFLMACTWKFVYYAGNTLEEWLRKKYPENRIPTYGTTAFWDPRSISGRVLWAKCILPYVLLNFIFIPSLFLFISAKAALFVCINMLLAEIMTNLHSFAVIVTNHTGNDLYRFSKPIAGKEDFYARQIAGSVNYTCGGFWNDYLHGYLNYQIEHHLWPDMTMLQYSKAHPLVKAIAHRHGIPYVQQPVWQRVKKTIAVMTGASDMPLLPDASVFVPSGIAANSA